ncbi:MAG: dTDP-4-dehydrorhamnose reductase [Flavobacteriales bacterium]|jgi:dTDP-4-dehydrorhamnose reductase
MNVNKKILITGSNGLLGQKLVKLLMLDEKTQFLATSHGNNRNSKLSDANYATLDITDEHQVTQLLEEYKPTVVINTAAMTNVDLCESKKEECWRINVDAVSYLISACENINSHLIHLSTDFVFDGKNGPYKEEDSPNPLSYYGESKRAAEMLLQKSNLSNWSIVRTIIVYGIGENLSRSNIVLWAKSALEKGDPLTIVDDQFRSPTYADDLAKGCLLISDKKANGIFHISGKDVMSILELVKRVANFYNLDASKITAIKSDSLNQAAKRPPITGFILDKAITELNYNPLSFEEGLSELEL